MKENIYDGWSGPNHSEHWKNTDWSWTQTIMNAGGRQRRKNKQTNKTKKNSHTEDFRFIVVVFTWTAPQAFSSSAQSKEHFFIVPLQVRGIWGYFKTISNKIFCIFPTPTLKNRGCEQVLEIL